MQPIADAISKFDVKRPEACVYRPFGLHELKRTPEELVIY
jgi:hypothetical protein